MATANTTSPRSAKAGKPAAKAAATRRGGSSASARSQSTKAKVTKAKSARTRSIHQTQSALRQTETATRNTVDVFGDYTERAVLIPVGAALIARDRVVSTVNDAISSYGSTTKAQAQLRRFERRGSTARNRLEREVRKARVRVERELRQRRRDLEQTVNTLEERRDAVAKNVTELPNRVQERILSIV
jgi:prefoldin subunit 5